METVGSMIGWLHNNKSETEELYLVVEMDIKVRFNNCSICEESILYHNK